MKTFKEEVMGNFCSQCGKPLQEGEVCTCQQQINPAQNQGENPA